MKKLTLKEDNNDSCHLSSELIKNAHKKYRVLKNNFQNSKNVGCEMSPKQRLNQVSTVMLYGVPIVSLYIESQERLCLAQISNTLLKQFSYNEIHNRRVALGITCVQCTPVQLEILRRAGAMPVSSRRCGMITRREAERLCKSFLSDNCPPQLPDDFAFQVNHECAWGCHGSFLPSRYNSSRAKCIKCSYCGLFFSPNKFIFHSHRTSPCDKYVQPDAANFNSWRRHMKLSGAPQMETIHAWEDVKAMFNGGTRKRLMSHSSSHSSMSQQPKSASVSPALSPRPHIKRIKVVNSGGNSPPQLILSTPISPNNSSPRLSSSLHLSSNTGVLSNSTVPPVTTTPSPTERVELGGGQVSILSPNNNENEILSNPTSTTTNSNLSDIAHLTSVQRHFCMDYIWHHHNQQNLNSSSTRKPPIDPDYPTNGSKTGSTLPFPTYVLPWIAASVQTSSSSSSSMYHQLKYHTHAGEDIDLPPHFSFYNDSALKPVLNNNSSITESDDHISGYSSSGSSSHSVELKDSLSSDDEMVDIETTEDDDIPRLSIDILTENEFRIGGHFNSENEPPTLVAENVGGAGVVTSKPPPIYSTLTNQINFRPTTEWYLKKENS